MSGTAITFTPDPPEEGGTVATVAVVTEPQEEAIDCRKEEQGEKEAGFVWVQAASWIVPEASTKAWLRLYPPACEGL